MIKIIKNFTLSQIFKILIGILLIVFQVYLDLKIPDYMASITRYVQTQGHTVYEILNEGKSMMIVAFTSLFFTIIIGYLAADIATSFSRNLRLKLFDKVREFSMSEINYFSTSSLITRSTNDLLQIQLFILFGFHILVKSPIMAGWAIIKIYNRGIAWTIATGITLIILIIYVAVLLIIAIPKFRKIQNLIDSLNRITRENISGMSVIRAYNSEDYRKEKFDNTNLELTRNQLFVNRINTITFPFISFSMSILNIVIYFIGASLISTANIKDKLIIFSNMVVFSSYAVQVIMSFMMMSMIFIILQRAQVSAKRVNEVLDKKVSITNGDISEFDNSDYELEFNNVSFRYTDSEEYVLKDINFNIKKGEKVAIIGSTGSGKTTLFNLILRFYDATDGVIKFRGRDIRKYDITTLYRQFGVVFQQALLLKGNIISNITFDDLNVNNDDIEKVCEISQSKDFILKFDKKYDHDIAQLGKNLSGGQKQRLTIARAMFKNTNFLLFDDSFSALDYATDSKLREAINNNFPNSTTLVVAQRVGSIIDSDKIIVLDNGKIVGMGKHNELMKGCIVYREIALSQISEEALSEKL